MNSPLRALALLACAGLALAAIPACQTTDLGSVSTPVGRPAVPTPEDAARYNDPIAVSQLRERALEEIHKLSQSPIPEVRANAIEAMAQVPTRLEPLIPAALKDENQGVRSTAAMMVGKARLQRIAPAVRPLLTDSSPYVRASAIFAMARNGLDVDRDPLATLLLQHPSPLVRAHTGYLIGEMADASALAMLIDASKAQMQRARPAETKLLQLQLAEAMVKLGDQTKLEVVRAAFYAPPEEVELTALAVQIVGELRDKASASELIYLTAVKDRQGNRMPPEIRLGAAAAMAKLGNTRGSFIADEFLSDPAGPLRAQAAFVYGQTRRRENLAKLEHLLSDPDPRVRISAASAIVTVTSVPAPS
jgi:HEAT repeat protein